jgi:predicted nuclease with TOPRIM domain
MSHVDAFETIVQETKRTSVLLLQEQEDIGMGVEGMEKEFVKVQAELARNSATKQKMQQENRKLSQELRYMKCRIDEVIDNLELEQSESLLMKRKYEELEITVQVQQSRSKRLQEDLDSTQALLLDSTSASTESKIALQDCKQAFDRMYVRLRESFYCQKSIPYC